MLVCAGEDDRPHISMDLSCGLFDLKTSEAAERAERIMNGTVPELQPPASEDDSASDSSDGGSQSPRHDSRNKPKGKEGLVENKHGKLQGPVEQARKKLRVRRTNAKIREL